MIRFAIMIALVGLCACQPEKSNASANAAPPPTGATAHSPSAHVAQADNALGSSGNSTVLPGTFSERTSVADLQARFGKANVTFADVPDGYGWQPFAQAAHRAAHR